MPSPRDEHAVSPFATLAPLALRLALVHVGLGIAEGALAEARDIDLAAPRRWPAHGRRSTATTRSGSGADPISSSRTGNW